MDGVSELFAEIVGWATVNGAGELPPRPGIWSGETDEWKVEINRHQEEIDGLPFAHARLSHKQYLCVAILHPYGGCIGGGISEDSMIKHFRAAQKAEARSDA